MYIRQAAIEDLETLFVLEQHIFDENSFPLSKRSLQAQLLKGNIYIACFDQEVVGYILVFRYRYTMRIYSLGVSPKFRNNKIGISLMKYVIEVARLEEFMRLSLEVKVSNHTAIRLYESIGFSVFKRLERYYPDCDGLKMLLDFEH